MASVNPIPCRPILIASLVVAVAVASTRADQQTYDLRPNFEAGRTTRYQIWTLRQTTTTMRVGPEKRTSDTSMQFDGEVTWTVQKVKADGSATCTMTLDWLTVTLTLPDGTVQHNDSRKGSGDTEAFHRLLRAMAGVPLVFNVNADGSVEKVSGTSAIRRNVGDDTTVPEDLDFIETATDLAVLAFAPADAELNDRWNAQFTWTHQMGRIDHTHRYTLSSVEQVAGIPIATVTGTGKLKLKPDMPDLPPDAPDIDVRLVEGSYQAQIMFDLQRHEAVGRNTVESHHIQTSTRLPQLTFKQSTEETIHSQALRIAEQ